MTLQELGRRAPVIIAAVVGAGAILGCALLAGTVAYLTKPATSDPSRRLAVPQAPPHR